MLLALVKNAEREGERQEGREEGKMMRRMIETRRERWVFGLFSHF